MEGFTDGRTPLESWTFCSQTFLKIIKNKGGREKRSGGGKRMKTKIQEEASEKGFG